MDQEEAQVIGTLVTVLGLIVVAPYATGAALVQPFLRVTLWASRWVPAWQPRFYGEANFSGVGVSVMGSGRGYTPWAMGLSIDAQIDELRAAVDTVKDQLATANERLSAEMQDRRVALKDLEDRLLATLAEHESRRREREADDHELELGALPLAATGALIAGCPFWFNESQVGAVFVVFIALLAAHRLNRSVGRIGSGARETANELGYLNGPAWRRRTN